MRPNRRAVAACAVMLMCLPALTLGAARWIDARPGRPGVVEAAEDAHRISAEHRLPPPDALLRRGRERSWWHEDLALLRRDSEPTATPTRSTDAAASRVRQPAPSPSATPSPPATPTPEAAARSVLRDNQLIVYYGTPLAAGLGVLGTMPPDDIAVAVRQRAAAFDRLNGDAAGAVPALDLIYSLAQAEPTGNGMYIRHLPDAQVRRYIEVAERHDLQLMLDLQIGRSSIIDEVRRIEPYLLNPRVHVAIDPEYAVGAEGVPIKTPGRITGAEINEVQAYLRELVEAHGLPPKILVVHQYMDPTIVDPQAVAKVEGVDYVLNMDAFGDVKAKKKKYRHFAEKPPETKLHGFNVFLVHDHAVLSEEELLQLSPLPQVIFYQ